MGGAACAVSSSAIRPQSACRQAAAAYAASLCGFMGVPPIPKYLRQSVTGQPDRTAPDILLMAELVKKKVEI